MANLHMSPEGLAEWRAAPKEEDRGVRAEMMRGAWFAPSREAIWRLWRRGRSGINSGVAIDGGPKKIVDAAACGAVPRRACGGRRDEERKVPKTVDEKPTSCTAGWAAMSWMRVCGIDGREFVLAFKSVVSRQGHELMVASCTSVC